MIKLFIDMKSFKNINIVYVNREGKTAMNKYECEILDDNRVKQLVIKKLLNIKNVIGLIVIIIFTVIIIMSFNKNILKPSKSVLREQELKNMLMLIIPCAIADAIIIIIFYIKSKKYIKAIKGDYKCIISNICEKKEEHDETLRNDGTIDSYSAFWVDVNGINNLIEISFEEYNSVNKNDKCCVIVVNSNLSQIIDSRNAILVVKANKYEGQKEVVNLLNDINN